jgi:hypothetical protein
MGVVAMSDRLSTTAQVVLDSLSPMGHRITTLQLCYPRFIHAEFMTHRVFSRNASSSRAIPVAKMIEQVRNNPAMPTHWGSNKPGMQAGEELQGYAREQARAVWLEAANAAADFAQTMSLDFGLHKQVANRILEPFQWMRTIVTATEWENFFGLRDHPAAEPNIQVLARAMKVAMDKSAAARLRPGEWHLPYVSVPELQEHGLRAALELSTARCARVSYLNHDGSTPDIDRDRELYAALVGNTPMHASPLEHQASPSFGRHYDYLSGNLRGWVQHRKLVELGRDASHYTRTI